MSTLPLTVIKSRSRKRPALSVLIPFYRDNPSELLTDLLVQASALRGVEILMYDDGTLDPNICAQLAAQTKEAQCPSRF